MEPCTATSNDLSFLSTTITSLSLDLSHAHTHQGSAEIYQRQLGNSYFSEPERANTSVTGSLAKVVGNHIT